MALAKIYDTEDTVMVPIDVDSSHVYVGALHAVAGVVADVAGYGDVAGLLRELAGEINNARIAVGLD